MGAVFGYGHEDGLADDFACAVTVKLLGALIPAGDDSLGGGAIDGIVGGFDDGGHLFESLVGAHLRARFLARQAGCQ